MIRIRLIPISLSELKPLIEFAFQNDPDLLTKYSLLKTDTHTPTLQESVDKNYETILEAINSPVFANDIKMYQVFLMTHTGNTSIGFTVTVTNSEPPHMLFSFGINHAYRSQKNVIKWLEQVKLLLGKFIGVTLHKNNTRVIDFFERNGFTKSVTEVCLDNVTLISNLQEYVKQRGKRERSFVTS